MKKSSGQILIIVILAGALLLMAMLPLTAVVQLQNLGEKLGWMPAGDYEGWEEAPPVGSPVRTLTQSGEAGELHPHTRAVLETVPKSIPLYITQGIGRAKASKDTHLAAGVCNGKEYAAAVDIKTTDPGQIQSILDTLWTNGIAAWYRNWSGNEHIHAVDPMLDMSMLPAAPRGILERQIIAFTQGGSGLKGNPPYNYPQPIPDWAKAKVAAARQQKAGCQ